MLGKNPKRSPNPGNGEVLEVKKIFKTIQGEGPFVGMPAIFIRLGGCNLACEFCDTDFENYRQLTLDKIIAEVERFRTNSAKENIVGLVVITGGEPLRQSITLLCQKLIYLNFIVQIETNGTLYRPLPKEVYIVCSPKAGKNGYSFIREDLLPYINAIKFIVAKNISAYNNIAEVGQTKYNIPVYIQPMDQNNELLNKENTIFAIELAHNWGYRLSIQTHKVLGIE